MIQRSQSIPYMLLATCILLQGCQSIKRNLGIERDPPNEYIVTPSAHPLSVPPNFSHLPVPVPGMESPQEREARQIQEQSFLGAPTPKEVSSPGQEALLDMCGVQPNQDNIRYEVDREAHVEEAQRKATVVQQLGISPKEPIGEILNPYQEAAGMENRKVTPNPNPIQQVIPPFSQKHRPLQNQRENSPILRPRAVD
jgi:hypothetical protein